MRHNRAVKQQQVSSSTVRCVTCHNESWRNLYHRQGWNFVRCTRCGLVRLDPIPTDEQLAHHYVARFESGNYEPAKALERLPTLRGVFDKFATSPSGRIFDVGCFDGGLLDVAADAGGRPGDSTTRVQPSRSREQSIQDASRLVR